MSGFPAMAGRTHHKTGRECVNVFIKDIFNEHPSLADRLVSVWGVAVEVMKPCVEMKPTRPLTLSLDDGTSEIKCVLFGFQSYKHLADVSVGQSFLASGSVSEYRQELQIKCESLKIVKDPNFETLWINKVLYEKKERYKKEESQ